MLSQLKSMRLPFNLIKSYPFFQLRRVIYFPLVTATGEKCPLCDKLHQIRCELCKGFISLSVTHMLRVKILHVCKSRKTEIYEKTSKRWKDSRQRRKGWRNFAELVSSVFRVVLLTSETFQLMSPSGRLTQFVITRGAGSHWNCSDSRLRVLFLWRQRRKDFNVKFPNLIPPHNLSIVLIRFANV